MDLIKLKSQIDDEISKLKTDVECAAFHQKYLSKSGEVTKLMSTLRDIEPAKRAEAGAAFNALKKDTEEKLANIQKDIKQREQTEKLMRDPVIDITIPRAHSHFGKDSAIGGNTVGGLHPITIIQREVEDIFTGMGFIIEDAPEIATEYQNFESVNVPKSHPARDMQDTFWLDDGRVLRTHTSMWQTEMMRRYGSNFKAICPGRCFRNENTDATHENTFFQCEGIMVGEDVSIANLIYFMKEMTQAVLKRDIKIRLRPGFFPFVEPGFEMDATCVFCGGKGCSVCKHTGWIELFPCGMIHPNVMREGGVDPDKYQGFAFGFGLTRLAMMRWGIQDIRLFNSGNLEFLKGSGGGTDKLVSAGAKKAGAK